MGLADVEGGLEAEPDTQYAIASITKTFVARAILMLRDEGKLKLDDPLGAYVPEANREGVTIRRALAHSSGIQRETLGEVWETMDFPDRETLLGSLGDVEQVLEPGRQWHYSNLVYALLGEVIAQVSGTPAERFVEERILRPLGLERTTWGPGTNAATGYFVERFADVAVPEPVPDKKAVAPAGALFSTVGDLAKWGAFLMEEDEMHAVQVMARSRRWLLAWGLGLMLHRRGERIFAGHDGGAVGHSSFLTYSRRERSATVLLTNTENPSMSFDAVCAHREGRGGACRPRTSRGGRARRSRRSSKACSESGGARGSTGGSSGGSGSLEARRPGRKAATRTLFEREGEDVYRTSSGREHGELLRDRSRRGRPAREAVLGDLSVYSYCSASRTLSREARRAGKIAAISPTAIATTTNTISDTIGHERTMKSTRAINRTASTMPSAIPIAAPISAVMMLS